MHGSIARLWTSHPKAKRFIFMISWCKFILLTCMNASTAWIKIFWFVHSSTMYTFCVYFFNEFCWQQQRQEWFYNSGASNNCHSHITSHSNIAFNIQFSMQCFVHNVTVQSTVVEQSHCLQVEVKVPSALRILTNSYMCNVHVIQISYVPSRRMVLLNFWNNLHSWWNWKISSLAICGIIQ